MIKEIFRMSVRNISMFLLFVLFLLTFNNCENDNYKPQTEIVTDTVKSNNDSVKKLIPRDPFPLITYHLDTIRTRQELREIRRKYRKVKGNFAAYKAFITLNRKELRFVRVGQAVVIPDTVIADMRA